MPKQRKTSDELVRKLADTLQGKPGSDKRSMVKATGDAGGQGGQTFTNPMTTEGDLIVGGESGAMTREGIGTEDQVLTVVDVSGDLVPKWADSTGGSTITILDDVPDVNAAGVTDGQTLIWDSGTSTWIPADAATAGARYRMYVLVPDGSGGFDFVVDGSGNLVVTLEVLE